MDTIGLIAITYEPHTLKKLLIKINCTRRALFALKHGNMYKIQQVTLFIFNALCKGHCNFKRVNAGPLGGARDYRGGVHCDVVIKFVHVK